VNTADGPDLRIRQTPQEVASECADYILTSLAETLKSQARVALAISGGSSPRLLFSDLAKKKFDWSKVHFFWVDERCVPPDNKESNFKLANDTLLGVAPVPKENIHRIMGELPPAEGASRYVEAIQDFFGLRNGQLPVFDILHRGMGPDGHTASLFPGTPLVNDRTRIATNVWVEKMKMDRVTLLPGVLLAAKSTVLQVSGAEKADVLSNVLKGPEDFTKFPCQIASRDRRATWFLDKAAAQKL
jgi:6-phosphogluconolactonase